MIVSPDEGALNRNMYYASVLGVELGMFYKRRDYSRVVDGRNPIVAHEYLGSDVAARTCSSPTTSSPPASPCWTLPTT